MIPGDDDDDDDGTAAMPDKFKSTMVGVPVATYALALLAAIYIGSKRVRSANQKAGFLLRLLSFYFSSTGYPILRMSLKERWYDWKRKLQGNDGRI